MTPIDMVSLWGLGAPRDARRQSVPGLWMFGGAERLLERAAPGVLHADLSACNAYDTGAGAARKVACPATLILGERDQMTPAKAGSGARRPDRRCANRSFCLGPATC